MKKHPTIDIGININNPQLSNDINSILTRAQQNLIKHIILTTTNIESLNINLKLCETHPQFLSTTYGLHPHQAKNLSLFNTQEEPLLNSNSIIAIGETGLDYLRMFSTQSEQIKSFEYFLELSQKTNKPMFLHERNAQDDFINIITNSRNRQTKTVHCFTGDKNTLKKYLDLGFFIGITGWLCDERRNQELLTAITYLPIDRIMFETDSPYLKPRNAKIKSPVNEPSHIHHIIHFFAQQTKQDIDVIYEAAFLNTLMAFPSLKDKNLIKSYPSKKTKQLKSLVKIQSK